MSSSKKKQTGKQSQSSSAKSNEETKSNEQPSTSDSETQENSQSPAGDADTTTEATGDTPLSQPQVPSGATMATGAGDPTTDAPADAPEGAHSVEETQAGQVVEQEQGEQHFMTDRKNPPQPSVAQTRDGLWKPLPSESEPEGRILEEGEEVEFDGTQEGNMVRVNEDVYRKVYPRGAKRPSYVRLYVKGSEVPITSVQSS